MSLRVAIAHFSTLVALGLGNVFRVATYRAMVRARLYRVILPRQRPRHGAFLQVTSCSAEQPGLSEVQLAHWREKGKAVLDGWLFAFSHQNVHVGFPPAWSFNAWSEDREPHRSEHWSDISEFRLASGDIKGVWEASRFDGMLVMALAAISGRQKCLAGVESWIADWVEHNPPNTGINWKCAQETSIRLLQTLLAVRLLARFGVARATSGLDWFVEKHCERVDATVFYATAQDNNHALSEAVALFVGGLWLRERAASSVRLARRAERWKTRGRRLLCRTILRLFLQDGTFSQYSTNYHRFALDLVSMAELWRGWSGEKPFNSRVRERLLQAADWLADFTDPLSGDAPNIGGNDGARAFVLHGLPYRDFRPTVQLATVLFSSQARYGEGGWDEPLSWLGVSRPQSVRRTASARVFEFGGFAKVRIGSEAWLGMRLPVHRFRPAHADALHLDCWLNGENVLRDGGSYGYNCLPPFDEYFSGTASHNTVQFDRRDQMPRLGRFLFGHWLSLRELRRGPDDDELVASYEDYCGATHTRCLRVLSDSGFVVVDSVTGFQQSAIVRWRLKPSVWTLHDRQVVGAQMKIDITSDVPLERIEILSGYESRYYGELEEIPVVEIEVTRAGTVTTTFELIA